MKTGVKIRKLSEYALTKVRVKLSERVFSYNGVKVKHILRKNKSRVLIVVFSACTRPGIPARYNYVRTLKLTKANKLFILDDFGADKRGSFYLGHFPELTEETATGELIKKTVEEIKPESIIFCGSCKGGYAALNFGTAYKNSEIIIGEPTYRIAGEFLKFKALLEYWMGDITEENMRKVDLYLSDKLKSNKFKNSQKIYYMYSGCDEYSERHTKPLLADLRENGYCLQEKEEAFKNHSDLGLYYAEYLKETLKKIM